jgi:hypothetical protein
MSYPRIFVLRVIHLRTGMKAPPAGIARQVHAANAKITQAVKNGRK